METAYFRTGSQVISKTNANTLTKVRNILSAIYIFIPIAAGLDKFLNILTDWTKYLHPVVTDVTGISAGLFMNIAGVIEITAGIIVFLNRRIGAYIVAAWLLAITIQLIAGWMYIDVAVRDIVMASGAFCLGLLSDNKEK